MKLDFRPLEAIGLELIGEYANALGTSYTLNRVFRGHASHEWKPVPSVYRGTAAGIEHPGELAQWRGMAQRFISPQPSSDLAYLVLAQHYGIATGLLDWTSNPLVALFFACQKLDDEIDGEVIQLDTQSLRSIKNNDTVAVFKSERKVPLLLDTSVMNVRSQAQDSVMTLHTAEEEPLDVSTVFRIPHERKAALGIALGRFGLTPERIYVDLTVAANSFKQELDNQRDIQDMLGRRGDYASNEG